MKTQLTQTSLLDTKVVSGGNSTRAAVASSLDPHNNAEVQSLAQKTTRAN